MESEIESTDGEVFESPGNFHGFTNQEKSMTIEQKLKRDFALASEESSEVSETDEEMRGVESARPPAPAEEIRGGESVSPAVEEMMEGESGSPPAEEMMEGESGSPPVEEMMEGESASPPAEERKRRESASPPAEEMMEGELVSPPAEEKKGRESASPPAEEKKGRESDSPPAEEASPVESSCRIDPKVMLKPLSISRTPNFRKEESPSPFKLKIKLGKDRSGEVILPDPPPDDEEGFHGFPDKEIPDFVFNRFDDIDLRTNFKFKPTIFVSISSKKQSVPGSHTKKPMPALSKIHPESPGGQVKTTPKTPKVRFADQEAEKQTPGPANTPASVSKKKGGNNRYFEPLYDGWVREVIHTPTGSNPNQKPKIEVVYTSPLVPGQGRFKFRSANQLEGHLITTGSMYPLTFFTFKKEALGAPAGLEVIRNSTSKAVSPPHEMEDGMQALGKRVSKPPDKLMEKKENNEVRTSRRVSKPPDKLDPDAVPPRPARRTAEDDRTARTSADTSGMWKDPENIVQSPKKSVTTGSVAGSSGGGLKVKMFSKLNAKNREADDNISAKDNDIDIIAERGPVVQTPATSNLTPVKPPITITKIPKVIPSSMPTSSLQRVYSSHMPIIPAPTPTLCITPVSSAQNPYPNLQAAGPSEPNVPVIDNVMSMLPSLAQSPVPKIVRPTKKTILPCSIHCPGVIGFPSLSCSSCHCLFHPKCVGLPATFANSNCQFDFFCNDCQPSMMPDAKATSAPPPPVLPLSITTSPAAVSRSANIPPRPSPVQQRPAQQQQQQQPPLLAKPVAPPQDKAARKKPKGPVPSRPIESQTMVSIGGKKFLVIPRANIELDSPPPSPPPPQDKDNSSRKLPVLLEPVDKPADAGVGPQFELEQTDDGRLILKPVGNIDPVKLFGARNLKRSADPADSGSAKRLKTNSFDIHSTMSCGYFAFLHVFKYLGVEERVRAARVCKMWNELAYHQSLWQSLSLKSVKVYDWRKFANFINRVGTKGIDMRKMIFVRDRESTWTEILTVFGELRTIRKIQLPRISGSVLNKLITCCPQLDTVNSPLTISPMDISVVTKVPNLKELRLKTGSGTLKLEPGLSPLEGLVNSLTSLSLLTVSGLSECDYDSIGTLCNLEQIELGDCTEAPVTLFKTLSDLVKLQRIRLEKGNVGDNISKLQKGDNLRQLELIDFHVESGFRTGLTGINNIRRLLIIPTYKNEVARSNTEIVEGVTSQLKHLDAFYLGVTNEWLEAMSLVIGEKQMKKAPGERECFPLEKDDRVDYISLPGLYRRICREMPRTKVKVLKMSAGATCKQFIRSLDK